MQQRVRQELIIIIIIIIIIGPALKENGRVSRVLRSTNSPLVPTIFFSLLFSEGCQVAILTCRLLI